MMLDSVAMVIVGIVTSFSNTMGRFWMHCSDTHSLPSSSRSTMPGTTLSVIAASSQSCSRYITRLLSSVTLCAKNSTAQRSHVTSATDSSKSTRGSSKKSTSTGSWFQ